MSEISFENFGFIAKKVGFKNIHISSSRYEFQKEFLPEILIDIKKKLEISSSDRLLDIGCGLGLFLIPLSFFCKEAYGLDHPNFVRQIKIYFKFFNKKNLISGNFLKLKLTKKFDKILIYSVVHYLKSEKELVKFIDKSLKLLSKKGIILIGDIPVYEHEKKFISSKQGKTYYQSFNKLKNSYKKKGKFFSISNYLQNKNKDNKLIKIDLSVVKSIKSYLEKKKYKVKVIRHKNQSIFSNTRIDILVKNCEK